MELVTRVTYWGKKKSILPGVREERILFYSYPSEVDLMRSCKSEKHQDKGRGLGVSRVANIWGN